MRIVTGRAKSGKSKLIYDEVSRLEALGEPSLIIVPARFTFECEKALAAHLGGGFMYANVCSFDSLSHQVFEENGEEGVFLSQEGRLMLIRRAIETLDITILGGKTRKTGFAKACDELLTAIQSARLTSNDLRMAAEGLVTGTPLHAKITDIISVYDFINGYLEENSINALDSYNALLEGMRKSKLCRSHVFIDGTDPATEQVYGIIGMLMETAASMTVCLRCDLTGGARDYNLFRHNVESYIRVKDMAGERGLDVDVLKLPTKTDDVAPALAHLERELFAYPYNEYIGDTDSIKLFAATDRNAEVNAVASEVLDSIKNGGLRYREIAVIAANEDAYGTIVRSVFKKAGIPVFSDSKRRLDSMPVSVLILSALNCVANGFQRDDIFALMKTGLCGLTRDEAELLENYMLEYGIFGSALKNELKRGNVTQMLESARAKLMKPLIRLRDGMSHGDISAKTEALYRYLEELNIREKLNDIVRRLSEQERFELMEECSQVWNVLIEILTQLNAIMGNISISNARYVSIIEEGLGAQTVSVIPAETDMVLFGSVEHTIPPGVKRLFIIGAVEGEFPHRRADSGLIDDAELAELKGRGLNVWQGMDFQIMKERLQIYSAMTLPTKALWVSYPMMVASKPAHPSALLEKMRGVFPGLEYKSNAGRLHIDGQIVDEKDTLAIILRNFADTGDVTEEERTFLARCLKNPYYSDAVRHINEALFYNASPNNINREFMAKLFENGLYVSATRLEQFNNCPFAHFIRYGLRAKERREFVQKAADMGSFCHDVLDAFVKRIIDNGMDYKSLTREECDNVLNDILAEHIQNYRFGILTESARAMAMAEFYSQTAKDTAFAIIRQMQLGKFEFLASEAVFGMNGIFPPLRLMLNDGSTFMVSGKVDRVDKFDDAEKGERYLRIVDYKKGGRSFDISELYAGVRLQLPLYLAAVSAAERAVVACGMYYLPVKQATANLRGSSSVVELEKKIQRAFRFSGLSLSEINVIEATDIGIVKGGEKKSLVIENVEMGDDGPSGKGVVSKEQLERIKNFALRKASETTQAIMNGHAEVSPYEYKNGSQKKIACKYCPYSSVCTIDKKFSGCRPRTYEKMSLNEFFDETV